MISGFFASLFERHASRNAFFLQNEIIDDLPMQWVFEIDHTNSPK